MNILKSVFAGMWRATEGKPLARKWLIEIVEDYNRRMAEINRRTDEPS